MYAQAIFTTLTRWGMHLLLILGVTISQATFGLAGQEKEQSQKPVANPKKNQKNNPEILAAFRPAIVKASHSTVRVMGDGKEVALGAIIGPDGWVLTKASELKGILACSLKDGRSFPARIIGVDEKSDLAMLKIEASGLPVLTLSESKAALVGYWVATTGLSEDPVAIGVVSVAARKLPPSTFGSPASGGGFLGVTMEPTESGVKVSRIEAGSAAEKAGLKLNDIIVSINGETVRDAAGYATAMAKTGMSGSKEIKLRIRRDDTDTDLTVDANHQGGIPGLTVQSSQEGAPIREVSANSAAEKAGMKAKDVVIAVGGQPIRDTDSLMALLRRSRPGQTLTFKVRRDQQELELKATLGKRPAGMNFDRSDFQNRMGSTLSERRVGFPVILQHDTVLRPQDCGGPLVDLDGNVIGINIARAGRVETFAIPAETVQLILADLMSGKLAPKTQFTNADSPAERVAAAKSLILSLEAQKGDVEKRLAEARAALAVAEAALKANSDSKPQDSGTKNK